MPIQELEEEQARENEHRRLLFENSQEQNESPPKDTPNPAPKKKPRAGHEAEVSPLKPKELAFTPSKQNPPATRLTSKSLSFSNLVVFQKSMAIWIVNMQKSDIWTFDLSTQEPMSYNV